MKKIFVIFLVVLISVGLYSETKVDKELPMHQVGRAPQLETSIETTKEFNLVSNQDLSRFDYDVYTGNSTGLTYNAVDLATGALTPTGAIATDPFPMAEEYDGTSIYRVYSDLTIVEVNPDDGTTTALGSVSGVAGTPTGLAYKWDTSTMYIVILDAGNAPHFCTLDLTTFVATEIGVGTGMVIAMDFAADGYLYTPTIDDDNLYQVDPATGISTLIGPIGYDLNYGQDVTYDFETDQLFTISCGGAYILGTYDLATGALTQIADMNGNQHPVLVSTIANADPGAPATVSNLVVTPDAGGALNCELDWVNPDLTFAGDPLTELLEIRVYRDGALIHTNSSPVIGDPDGYSDVLTGSGFYNYSVVAYNSVGEGPAVSFGTWIGEDVPNVVVDLLLEQTTPGVLSGTLTWVNPSTGLNGGAFNEAILGYHIERSDGVVLEVTGLMTEYIDTTIPVASNYYYTVQPYNSIGDGGIETSNAALIADAGLLLMEGFEGGVLPGDWTNEYLVGATDWTFTYGVNATHPADPHDGAFNAYFNGNTGDKTKLITPQIDMGTAIDVTLTFWHAQEVWAGDQDVLRVYYKDSVGAAWTLIEEYLGNLPAWTEESISLPNPSSDYYIAFEAEDGWGYGIGLDDVMITMPAADPGYIEGTVVIADGAGNVEDVEVEAGGVTTNPAADGTYSIELQPGTYDVTATLVGYDEETITGVIITEGNTTSGVDFSLVTDGDEIIIAATKLNGNYPNPFNPVTTIDYSIKETGNVTLEVYNLRGQLVKRLVNEVKQTGNHTVVWNGTDNSNKSVSSGVYFYKMVSEGNIGRYTSTKKMILMK